MKTNKFGKIGFMTMKLDMSKAYDRVEWKFLLEIMDRMGFHFKWIGWILECISSVSFSIMVMVNWEGIGDPLSPYLFLLCLEGLNSLIQHVVAEGSIQGFSLCQSGLKISYLFFANDNLLFCCAKVGDIQTILNILQVYEKTLGQMINTKKSTLFFSKSVTEEVKNSIKAKLEVLEIKQYEMYLGLPTVVGKNRSASLN